MIMPRDFTRVTYDENGGMVTAIPKGTPKEEIAKAREEGRVDKNDPAYDVEDAKKDLEENEKAEKELYPQRKMSTKTEVEETGYNKGRTQGR